MLKPRLVLSSCLNLEKTRYEGNLIENPVAIKLRKFCEIISVCPELGIGLSVPRERIILYKDGRKIKAVEILTGKDFTEDLKAFSKKFIKNILEVEGFFLKSKSPSCGVSHKTKVYKDIEGKNLCGKSQGIFAKIVLKAFSLIPVVDEEILKNKDELENFLIKIFSLRRLRELKEKAKSKEDIISFHKKAYYLLKSYAQESLKKEGAFLLSEDISFENLLNIYETFFKETLAKPFKRKNQINTVLKILEDFSEFLKDKEKYLILNFLEKYEKGKIPLIEVLSELKNLLQDRTSEPLLGFYLSPYPEELKELFY